MGLAFFVFFALILYRNNRQKQRLNEQLSLQKKEIENLNEGLEQKVEQRTAELQQALDEVQTAFAKGQTVERKRVSADLHDEIGQYLTAVHIDASAMVAAKKLTVARESATAIAQITRTGGGAMGIVAAILILAFIVHRKNGN